MLNSDVAISYTGTNGLAHTKRGAVIGRPHYAFAARAVAKYDSILLILASLAAGWMAETLVQLVVAIFGIVFLSYAAKEVADASIRKSNAHWYRTGYLSDMRRLCGDSLEQTYSVDDWQLVGAGTPSEHWEVWFYHAESHETPHKSRLVLEPSMVVMLSPPGECTHVRFTHLVTDLPDLAANPLALLGKDPVEINVWRGGTFVTGSADVLAHDPIAF